MLRDEDKQRTREIEQMKRNVLQVDSMPDQVTCTRTPRDHRGKLMISGSQYSIFGKRVLCFEDDGTLHIQACYADGQPARDSTPQRVDSLPTESKPHCLTPLPRSNSDE